MFLFKKASNSLDVNCHHSSALTGIDRHTTIIKYFDINRDYEITKADSAEVTTKRQNPISVLKIKLSEQRKGAPFSQI
jgi:hypothetical protein